MDRLRVLLRDVLEGHRLSDREAGELFRVRDRKVWEIARAADELRDKKCGNIVSFVRNQNVNVTNICVNNCGFCGYTRKTGDPDAYFHDPGQVTAKVVLARERGVTEICTVSGLHPQFDADAYVDIIRCIHSAAPGIHIHASNPMEVAYGAAKSGIPTADLLLRMKEAGLGSMCGTAAEILVDEVRDVICPQKIRTREWARIICEAHRLSIPTTATIMYGHCESVEDVVRHLSIIRDIQDETHGFTEFVPLSFIHMNTPLFRSGQAKAGATGREDLLMIAVSRLYLDSIDHIQVSWVKLGVKCAQIGLLAGADDLGGTMYEERISKGAGATDTDYLDPEEMKRLAIDLGREFRQRTTLYTYL